MADPLSDQAPIPDEECWFRVLTNKDHVRNGRLHHSALRGRALVPPLLPKPWSHELSGRVRSLVTDVAGEGEAFVRLVIQGKHDRGEVISRSLAFVGVAYAEARLLRRFSDPQMRTDVIYTPREGDNAHADFVVFASPTADVRGVADWLQETLRFAQPDKANVICDLSGTAPLGPIAVAAQTTPTCA